jgi:hypothetical protein
MKITSYTVRRAADLPPEVFHEFDSIDTRFIAGFENYQAQLQRVYVTWSRDGRPTAISTLAGSLITSCVDAGPWNGDNNWNNEIRRARAMMEHWLSVSPFLVVHDADYEQPWLELGFRELEPPADAVRPLRVFAYGEPPPLEPLFRVYGVSWEHPEWRFKDPEPPSEEAMDAMRRVLEAVERRRHPPAEE